MSFYYICSMKSATSKKLPQNKKPSKYDEVFKVNASFEDIMQIALNTNKRDLKSYSEIQKLKKID